MDRGLHPWDRLFETRGYTEVLDDREMAALADLHVDSADEALTLIPSLRQKFPGEAQANLQRLINDLLALQAQN